MKKHNRGAALAYAIMLTLVVFAVCTMVLTIVLSQVVDGNTYAVLAERERVCAQIGDLFHDAKGEHAGIGGSSEVSAFKKALEAHGFAVEIEGENWTVKEGLQTFTLTFDDSVNTKTLTIGRGGETYLTVCLDSDGKITAWQRGA